ncbi:two-component system response regulator (stage 0 sporulation protein F) [Sporomusaceae bacterium BoRhaA]|jgi:two-component system, response regulator, stage 0 sporulation protein F|uniref:response regulator n=1 Tax=Pelorhabdus rhamnosifermentans TaxID=2772457 RepID=UPI001FE3FCE5|nr:response regulator [Pelorhabdus rhamnosifermentans]MBU2700698.1 two-component system response regulator (stage 0 sporulation protein F) [Pelorhabdus rhamnosifermentans]
MSDTVLVIDDQPGIRRLLVEVLKEEGYQVVTASNGYDGLQEAQVVKPQLILMDMKMPGMDGIETLKELKRVGQGDRVIMMTAYGELDLVNQAREIGAYDYITKPFDIIALCQTIQEIMTHSAQDQTKIG